MSGRGPDRPEVGVLALVPDRWEAVRMPRHQVLERLGRHFHVVWLNPAPHWREVVATSGRHRLGTREVAPGVEVQSADLLLPRVHRPRWLEPAALALRLRLARRRLLRRGCRSVVLYLWRPGFDHALGVPHDLSCYHIDDEYTFSPEERPVSEREAELMRAVDQVFIHSPALLEKKGGFNPHTAFVPNGVDFDAFARPAPEPADLGPIPGPRIGYAGMLKRQLDWGLLLDLARGHREWSFVFVGGRSPHPEIEAPLRELEALPNAHFLGAKTPEELARYPQHFDVCLMPYRANDYTRFIYPLKLHEYLAGGRPTVGTPIRSLRQFAQVLWLPESPEEWSTALAEALAPGADDEGARERRREVARQHDWSRIVGRIAELIRLRLGEKGLPAGAPRVAPGRRGTVEAAS